MPRALPRSASRRPLMTSVGPGDQDSRRDVAAVTKEPVRQALHPTTRYCPPGTERADLAEQDLVPDSREPELLERARPPRAHVS